MFISLVGLLCGRTGSLSFYRRLAPTRLRFGRIVPFDLLFRILDREAGGHIGPRPTFFCQEFIDEFSCSVFVHDV